VAAQDKDPNSILNHFRKMTRVRKGNPVLVYGQYEILERTHPTVYAYTRTLDADKMLVLLNFSEESSSISLSELGNMEATVINNYSELQIENNAINLLPYQAVILKLK
jgi:oligo-1,6-glucosidase